MGDLLVRVDRTIDLLERLVVAVERLAQRNVKPEKPPAPPPSPAKLEAARASARRKLRKAEIS